MCLYPGTLPRMVNSLGVLRTIKACCEAAEDGVGPKLASSPAISCTRSVHLVVSEESSELLRLWVPPSVKLHSRPRRMQFRLVTRWVRCDRGRDNVHFNSIVRTDDFRNGGGANVPVRESFVASHMALLARCATCSRSCMRASSHRRHGWLLDWCAVLSLLLCRRFSCNISLESHATGVFPPRDFDN